MLLAPWLVAGVLSNWLFNILIASVVALDPPQELYTTNRLSRYRESGGRGLVNPALLRRWRVRLSDFVCREWLNPFDEGHC